MKVSIFIIFNSKTFFLKPNIKNSTKEWAIQVLLRLNTISYDLK